jgi:hypothetical protein
MFASKASAYQGEAASFMCSTLVYAPGRTHKHQTWRGKACQEKNCSLIGLFISYEDNKELWIGQHLLIIGPMSYSLKLHKAGKACQRQTLGLFGPICKL